MKTGFVCTNYNASAVTRAAVASLRACRGGADVPVVVVDNRSAPEDAAALRAMALEFPRVDLLENPENAGYFPGLNLGIRRLRAAHPEVEALVVGNNDLLFPEDFLERLREIRDVFSSWAVVSPDLVTPAGVHQNPHVLRPIGRFRKLVWDVHFSSYAAAVLVRAAAWLTRPFTVRAENAPAAGLYRTPGPIEQGYGACYVLGPLFFRHFQALCAPTFMMEEEFFLGEQLRTVGQSFYYDPRLVVVHASHASTSRLPGRRRWEIARDAHAVYKRYLGLPPEGRAAFLRAAAGLEGPGPVG